MAITMMNRCDRANETMRLIMGSYRTVAVGELQEDAALRDDGVPSP